MRRRRQIRAFQRAQSAETSDTVSFVRWLTAKSDDPSFHAAVDEVLKLLSEQDFAPEAADLVLVFASSSHAGHWDSLAREVSFRFPRAKLVGCSAGGVVAGGQEIEEGTFLAVTVASLPDVRITPLALASGAKGLPSAARDNLSADEPVHALLFVDPETPDIGGLLSTLDDALPSGAKVGGLAAGTRSTGEVALFLQRARVHAAAVGVLLQGNLRIETLVAQGCRPIGEPFIATRTRDNVIQELGGRKAADVLREVHDALSDADKRLFRTSLFLGIEACAQNLVHKGEPMLMRTVLGFDPSLGTLAVGASIERHQVVQFQLRDKQAAHDELHRLLGARGRSSSGTPSGVLMFSCVGRGREFFGASNHDSELLSLHLGPLPVGGFFCNGEIGPVGDKTYLHSYTSVLALVSPLSPKAPSGAI